MDLYINIIEGIENCNDVQYSNLIIPSVHRTFNKYNHKIVSIHSIIKQWTLCHGLRTNSCLTGDLAKCRIRLMG